jgi:hypothetical protein
MFCIPGHAPKDKQIGKIPQPRRLPAAHIWIYVNNRFATNRTVIKFFEAANSDGPGKTFEEPDIVVGALIAVIDNVLARGHWVPEGEFARTRFWLNAQYALALGDLEEFLVQVIRYFPYGPGLLPMAWRETTNALDRVVGAGLADGARVGGWRPGQVSLEDKVHLLNCINPVSDFAGSGKTTYAYCNNTIKPGIPGGACFK